MENLTKKTLEFNKKLNEKQMMNKLEEVIVPSLDGDETSLRGKQPKARISQLPKEGYGANVARWPARLHATPERLQSIKIDAFISRKDFLWQNQNIGMR
ncbi:hypothetical protein Fmac_016730 [Flemingia macrophylla]|uniref:Uncharacterized protein n=1 Tax=Flemingia macrophylla TaxID=520843 RepID=A0ABD1MI93_9FABA